MEYFSQFAVRYGWMGIVLAGALVALLSVQIHYYLFRFGRIPGYKNSRSLPVRRSEPPVSVIVPMFSEDYLFTEERLPLFLAQEYAPGFEIVIVYVGRDGDFFEDLQRIRHGFPQVVATKIEQDPRFPISPKLALNVGIKLASHEHLLFASTDVRPTSDRWIALMAKGFTRGDIVLGYCGLDAGGGLAGRWMRTDRMMESMRWLARAVARRPYRGIRNNMGFTKSLYFGVRGFDHLNMNIGEDDLFLQRILTRDNASVILSPRATLVEKCWGGLGWWTGRRRFFGSSFRFYPWRVRRYIRWEVGSRLLFFAAAAAALVSMPPEYRIAVGVAVLLRYAVVLATVVRVAHRLGERRLCGTYFVYDLLSPLYDLTVGALRIRRVPKVWR